MDSKNSQTPDPQRLLQNLPDLINLRKSDKHVALAKLSIYHSRKNIKKSYENNKLKISAPTWSEKFELHDGSYPGSDIQDYLKYIIKKHETVTDNPPIRIYVNQIENRITFRIKTGYCLKLLTSEMMKFFLSTKSKITEMKMMKMCLV